MKVLFIGDIVGNVGRQMIEDYLYRIRKDYQIDLTVSAAIGDRKEDDGKIDKIGNWNIGIIKAGTEIYGYDTYDSLLSFTKK